MSGKTHVGRAAFSSGTEPTTTLRMPRADLERLRQLMEADLAAGSTASNREYKRWPFDRIPVKMETTHPGGAVTCLPYACRNLSRGGIGLLHSAFVHEGTKCVVILPHPERGEIKIPGKIVRVRHVTGKVHEIGVKFDMPVDVRRVLRLDPSEGGFMLEKVNPEHLKGSLLYIEDSELDRSLVRHFLSESNLDLTPAKTAAEAMERAAADEPDVILCDLDLPDMNGLELFKKLRAAGISAPFVLISADPTSSTRIGPNDPKPENFLVKPTTKERLLSTLGEILLLEGQRSTSRSAIATSLEESDPLRSQVPSFIGEVARMAELLSKAIETKDAQIARRLAFQIKGSAPTLGFATLGEIASGAYTAVTSSMSVEEAERELKILLAACKRLRAA
jgi:CheY-like chemotaxis protein